MINGVSMYTSLIKIFLVIIFLMPLFKETSPLNKNSIKEENISYATSDTTRGKKEKTTKTRVPKDKGEKERGSDDSDDDDFWGSCFSTCLFNMFFGGNGETETEDEIIEEEVVEEEETKKTENETIKTEEDTGAAYGGFLGLNLNGDGFFGNIADEYKDPGVSLGIDGFAFYKKFALNLGVTFGYNSAEPQYDYITNNGQGIEIVDIPDKSEMNLTYFNFGINYIFTDYQSLSTFGFLLGAGISYIGINEETELVRETYQQDTLISSVNTIEKINRSVVSPIISCTLIGSFSPKFWFNVNISYTFLNLDPQKKLSTPLDFNEVNGQLKIGFGLWYKIF
jgi:hypothetical protein